jgi:hypothetical protein
MTELRNGSDLYQIGDRVAETDDYRLYLCKQEGTGRQCLLQIAKAIEKNGGLARAAYILGELKRRAYELEAEYALVRTNPNSLLNYQLGFPELVDSFICQEQGGRQINILAFRDVEDVSKMVPLTNITEKDQLRVDIRTSAWIMGKILKMLAFAFSERFSVDPTGNNILIEPDNHYALIFDWAAAQIHSKAVPAENRRQQISHSAQAVITVLGGDLETGIFPDAGDKNFTRYTDYLLRLARGNESDAKRAHTEFYKIVDTFWKREFYPFTVKPLK